MSSHKLELRNDLKGENVSVKEGNAGVFKHLAVLTPGQTHTLRCDPNATYREFVLINASKKELPLLSTDLFQEYKEIIVFKDGVTYDWRGTPRRVARPPATGEAATGEALQANRQGRVATLLQRLFLKS